MKVLTRQIGAKEKLIIYLLFVLLTVGLVIVPGPTFIKAVGLILWGSFGASLFRTKLEKGADVLGCFVDAIQTLIKGIPQLIRHLFQFKGLIRLVVLGAIIVYYVLPYWSNYWLQFFSEEQLIQVISAGQGLFPYFLVISGTMVVIDFIVKAIRTRIEHEDMTVIINKLLNDLKEMKIEPVFRHKNGERVVDWDRIMDRLQKASEKEQSKRVYTVIHKKYSQLQNYGVPVYPSTSWGSQLVELLLEEKDAKASPAQKGGISG